MKSQNQKSTSNSIGHTLRRVGMILALAGMHSASFAAFDSAHITGMITDIDNILKTLSIIIVTIAFVFAGYQIAFGGKRFADVMPVVVGAIIIGAAAQLAALAARA
jgi:type IV secretion system protein VirB2